MVAGEQVGGGAGPQRSEQGASVIGHLGLLPDYHLEQYDTGQLPSVNIRPVTPRRNLSPVATGPLRHVTYSLWDGEILEMVVYFIVAFYVTIFILPLFFIKCLYLFMFFIALFICFKGCISLH